MRNAVIFRTVSFVLDGLHATVHLQFSADAPGSDALAVLSLATHWPSIAGQFSFMLRAVVLSFINAPLDIAAFIFAHVLNSLTGVLAASAHKA